MESISIDNLDRAIKERLEEYSNEVKDEVIEITHQVSKEFKENTKKDAPRGNRQKFYKNIDVKQNETLDGAVDTWYVKDPEYRITHLIKNGHQKRNGKGRTKSNDFIDRNYEQAEKEFEEKLVEVISSEH